MCDNMLHIFYTVQKSPINDSLAPIMGSVETKRHDVQQVQRKYREENVQ